MNASVSKAWYRHPMVWLVIAPPIGSVIAGIITMILILNHPDRGGSYAASDDCRYCTAAGEFRRAAGRLSAPCRTSLELLSLWRAPGGGPH